MRLLMFYDTETTRLPLWSKPSSDERQPHIVQAAAVLVDSESRKVVGSFDLTAYPDGWESDEEALKIHGITAERAEAVGIAEETIVALLYNFAFRADVRIGHVESFDSRIMRIAFKRFEDDAAADEWKELTEAVCTARLAKKAMNLPGRRNPKLTEVHEHFFGTPHTESHTAMADVLATVKIYWAMVDVTNQAIAEEAEPLPSPPAQSLVNDDFATEHAEAAIRDDTSLSKTADPFAAQMKDSLELEKPRTTDEIAEAVEAQDHECVGEPPEFPADDDDVGFLG